MTVLCFICSRLGVSSSCIKKEQEYEFNIYHLAYVLKYGVYRSLTDSNTRGDKHREMLVTWLLHITASVYSYVSPNWIKLLYVSLLCFKGSVPAHCSSNVSLAMTHPGVCILMFWQWLCYTPVNYSVARQQYLMCSFKLCLCVCLHVVWWITCWVPSHMRSRNSRLKPSPHPCMEAKITAWIFNNSKIILKRSFRVLPFNWWFWEYQTRPGSGLL